MVATLTLLVILAGGSSAVGGSPSGAINMVEVATVPTRSFYVLARPDGFDFDHDGRREFIINPYTAPLRFEFYESAGDDLFSLVHTLFHTIGTPGDVGDADGDGRSELLLSGRVGQLTVIQQDESAFPAAYPTYDAWSWSRVSGSPPGGGRIADTDGDGLQEIIWGSFENSVTRVAIYENRGDNDFEQTLHHNFPPPY